MPTNRLLSRARALRRDQTQTATKQRRGCGATRRLAPEAGVILAADGRRGRRVSRCALAQ